MRNFLVALSVLPLIIGCGDDGKKSDNQVAPSPPVVPNANNGNNNFGPNSGSMADMPIFDPAEFSYRDLDNDKYRKNYCEDLGSAGRGRPRFAGEIGNLRLMGAKSYENLVKDPVNGQYKNQGGCLVDLDVNDYEIRVRVERGQMKNKSVGLGQSNSCVVNLNLDYRPGFQFAVQEIYTDVINEVNNGSYGRFALDYGVVSDRHNALEYRRKFSGQRNGRYDLSLDPRGNTWSSCSGRDTVGVSTFFDTNFVQTPQGVAAWDAALRDKSRNQINHGALFLENGEYIIRLKWSRCD